QIDAQTKAYIDSACQNTISTIIEKVKELIDQQAENQRRRQSGENYLLDENQAANASPVTVSSATETREDLTQGNYPSTPILNHMLANMLLPGTTSASNMLCKNEDSQQTDKSLIVKKG
ncbi:10297_t:CDS:2, partial [Dentiscutata erythropus]